MLANLWGSFRHDLGLVDHDALHPGQTGGTWRVLIDNDGVIVPGSTLHGQIQFTADQLDPATSFQIRLTGCEKYQVFRVPQHGVQAGARGGVYGDYKIYTTDLMGPTNEVSNQQIGTTNTAFELIIDPKILPTVLTNSYQVIWALEVRPLISGQTTKAYWRRQINVVETAERIAAGGLDYGENISIEEAPAESKEAEPCLITLSPMPLVAGQPFSGTVQIAGVNPQKLRVSLYAEVQTLLQRKGWAGFLGPQRTNLNEDLLVGTLVPAGPDLYSFDAPAAPAIPCLDGPHGILRTTLIVTEERTLAQDGHWSRAVAIVTDPRIIKG
jgi:hypothetical protein